MPFRCPVHRMEQVAVFMVTLYLTMIPVCDSNPNNKTDIGIRIANPTIQSDNQLKQSSTKGLDNLPIVSTDKNKSVTLNETHSGHNNTATERLTQTLPVQYEKKLPLGLIISSPAVLVAVAIFICITYKWHSNQLDAQARELAEQIQPVTATTPFVYPSTSGYSTPYIAPSSSTTQGLIRPDLAMSDIELNNHRLNSLRAPSPTHLEMSGKRGSCSSSISDREILAMASSRRHSTFIL